MSLSDNLKPRALSMIARAMEQMNDEDLAAFNAAVEDPRFTNADISRALRASGYPDISEFRVRDHRRKINEEKHD